MRRLLSFFLTCSLLSPQLASARYADDILRVREDTDQRSDVQREEQRARKRAYENRPTELQSRLKQKKPTIRDRRVSQRQRRKTTEVWKSQSQSELLKKERQERSASVRTPTALEKLRAEILLAVNSTYWVQHFGAVETVPR